jgi:hypothetical protein
MTKYVCRLGHLVNQWTQVHSDTCPQCKRNERRREQRREKKRNDRVIQVLTPIVAELLRSLVFDKKKGLNDTAKEVLEYLLLRKHQGCRILPTYDQFRMMKLLHVAQPFVNARRALRHYPPETIISNGNLKRAKDLPNHYLTMRDLIALADAAKY